LDCAVSRRLTTVFVYGLIVIESLTLFY